MKIFFFLSFILSFSFAANSQSLILIREQLYRAQISGESADSFYAKMQSVTASASALMIGYKGMAAFMLCNYSYNPYNKLKYFNEGKNLLDKAIAINPANSELRFLRYTIQLNAPSFLGYNSNLNDDKKILQSTTASDDLKKTDKDLFNRISNFLNN